MEEEYKILKKMLKDSTDIMRKNDKYYKYDRDELKTLVMMYHDIILHTNIFLIELREGNDEV